MPIGVDKPIHDQTLPTSTALVSPINICILIFHTILHLVLALPLHMLSFTVLAIKYLKIFDMFMQHGTVSRGRI